MAPKTVAVIGSDSGLESSDSLAVELGRALAKRGFWIVIGSVHGLPLKAAEAAKRAGARVYDVSPWESAEEHRKKYGMVEGLFDFVAYTGFGLKGRNVVLVRSADAVAMVGGGMGTLNEFTVAFDAGKIIGVLEGSGGTSDMVRRIAPLGRDNGARIVYSRDPKKLAEEIHRLLKKRG
jgi:hypothetical protein